ncbi:hypothetical protein B0I35DRAFT_157548 [Stachybotrys elegans]|uniref:Uncharacterized protein n=1 Tax=Stachybotrys elegans TaxID=80388 RepID=A0A8K0WV92_9HYPO|nr:hypothetical protein B0I35DRAFT_157548 [Stachybotrys elegans]
MAPQRIFLDLPGEVRRAIYDAYFIEDGGYVYNFKTRKLEARDRNGAKQPIDHALRLTCKQVAHETHGLALNVNIIHFAADYSDEMRVKAACTHFSLYSRVWTPAEVLRGRDDEDEDDDNEEDDDDDQHQQAQQGQQDQQGQLDEPPIPYVEEDESDTVLCGFTEAILEEAIQEFPRAESFLRAVLSNDRTVVPKRERNDWGPPRSYIHRTILRVYELALKYNTFPQHWYPADPNVHFYHKDHEHWAPARLLPYLKKYPTWCYIPPGPKNEELRPFIYSIKQTEEHWERPRYRDLDGHTQYTEGKYRFSAAAAAIKFLSQFPIHFRRHLRRIHLNEHSISVSMPETHGHGLIEYCQENRHLRIERRADMWRTVFQTPCTNREMGAPNTS